MVKLPAKGTLSYNNFMMQQGQEHDEARVLVALIWSYALFQSSQYNFYFSESN